MLVMRYYTAEQAVNAADDSVINRDEISSTTATANSVRMSLPVDVGEGQVVELQVLVEDTVRLACH